MFDTDDSIWLLHEDVCRECRQKRIAELMSMPVPPAEVLTWRRWLIGDPYPSVPLPAWMQPDYRPQLALTTGATI